MSVESIAIVLHHSKAKGTDKLVLLGIANHEGDGGAWPAVATLARYAGVDERTVQRSLKRLESAGELSIAIQAGGPSGIPAWRRPNRYEVALACPATCDRTRNHRNKPLPQAPADLWKEGVTPTSPGDAHVTGGVTPTSPGGVTPASPEPSIEPDHETPVESGTQGQYARGDEAAPEGRPVALRCDVCGRLEFECLVRVEVSGHQFTPATRRPPRARGQEAEGEVTSSSDEEEEEGTDER